MFDLLHVSVSLVLGICCSTSNPTESGLECLHSCLVFVRFGAALYDAVHHQLHLTLVLPYLNSRSSTVHAMISR